VDGEPARYRAFISYSHRDAAFGRRLHRRLEGYRLPRRLVGRATPHGPAPARLAPIFRDHEELPAAHDLSAQVRAALGASQSLVVVCSPHARASPWVAREVALFRELHPGRPVLAALIEGEPGEAFPDALRRMAEDDAAVEPLAADFRRHRDGARLGLLKLVAGIAGVGLDELVQRDAQRRLRSVTAITAASLTLALGMGALAAVALQARAEAERQRAEAEGLVEFMLTDLRDRLEGVGRLDVLTAVNKRALAHYAGQPLDHLSAEALERRARILHAMGEDDERRGDLKRALAQFQEAHRTTGELLAADPRNPDRIYAHAQSEYWVAFTDWRLERFDRAQAGFERYAALAANLASADPGKPEWLMEVGYAESNLGMMALRDRVDPVAGRARFDRALRHYQAAAKADPKDAEISRQVADAHAWLADCERGLGRFREAKWHRGQEAVVLQALAREDAKNAVYQRDLLGSSLGLAQIEMDSGNFTAAEVGLANAYIRAARLEAEDPSDKKVARQKVAIGLFLAKARLALGGPIHTQAAVATLENCASPLARADTELRDFCELLTARAQAQQGVREGSAFRYIAAHRDRLTATRRTPRWGIDLRQELLVIG